MTTNENLFAAFAARGADAPSGPPTGTILRPAQESDAPGLAALLCEREGGDPARREARFREEIRDHGGDAHRLLMVATQGERTLGYGRAVYFEPPVGSPENIAPAGWYLAGVIVGQAHRRQGIGAELTRRRLEWVQQSATEAFYFVNAQNRVSLALHDAFHFEEVTRDFVFPGVAFVGGEGVLFRAALPLAASDDSTPR